MCSPRRTPFLPAGGLLILALIGPGGAAEPAGDPVAALRQALVEAAQPAATPKQGENEQARLARLADAVRGSGELRRAVLLLEWRGGQMPEWNKKTWDSLAGRLEKSIRKNLAEGNPTRRLAAVTFVAEMNESERRQAVEAARVPGRRTAVRTSSTFTPRLGPALHDVLTGDKDPSVRAAAAKALALVAAGAPNTVADLRSLLTDGKVIERRAAAEALGRALVLQQEVQQGGQPPHQVPEDAPAGADPEGPDRWRPFVLGLQRLTAVAGLGLRDDDPEVRRGCLAALATAVGILKGMVPLLPEGVPPGAADLNEEQQLAVASFRGLAQIAGLLGLTVNDNLPAVIRVAADPDIAVCVAACKTLETAAAARRKMLAGAPWVPALAKEQGLAGLTKAPPALARTLGHKDVRARLAALYVLETLGDEALPALDALVKAAADENAFVRWGVGRALRHLAPQEPELVVPALAALAADQNLKVRLTAIKDLEHYGPRASRAVKELTEAADKGDAATRVAALRALAAVGGRAQPAVPVLIRALQAPEAPVRAAAARALGRLDGGEEGIKALRKALEDSDAEVRTAASDALLEDR
jgi:HEAT repeat protein